MIKHKLIGTAYKHVLKPIFFKFDPEFVHDKMTNSGHLLGTNVVTKKLTSSVFNHKNKSLVQVVDGVEYANPVGLSAGFDKNAKLTNILEHVGFGFTEIGSVTYNPYAGNPKPRLYRLKKSKGLVVYYGLKNDGVKNIAERIKKASAGKLILGISIAKTNAEYTSTEEGGIQDYFDCLKYLEDNNIGHYYTINISCPNTFGGEPFTTEEKLDKLLNKLSEVKTSKPIYIKMPINLPIEEFDKLLKVAVKYKINGVVIGNLTKVKDSDLIKDTIPEHVKGGISGKPTEKLCNELISYTYKNYGKQLTIIGVGGIFSAHDAYEKIKRGSTLLELITGMIFEGPQLIGEINHGLAELLKKDGYSNISQAIGDYNK